MGNEWTATSGRNRIGLCTRWLSELEPEAAGGLQLPACVHASAVALPDTHKTPMVMVGLGTGIAPMRCFIEERVMASRAGEECGEMALFFGARNRQEYSYEEEFDAYHKEGPLTFISTALSREQKEKIYVTHRLAQNPPHLRSDPREAWKLVFVWSRRECAPSSPCRSVQINRARGWPHRGVRRKVCD